MGVKEANGNKEHNESNMALLDPHGYSVFIQGNILHPTINPNQGNPYKERIPPITLCKVFFFFVMQVLSRAREDYATY